MDLRDKICDGCCNPESTCNCDRCEVCDEKEHECIC